MILSVNGPLQHGQHLHNPYFLGSQPKGDQKSWTFDFLTIVLIIVLFAFRPFNFHRLFHGLVLNFPSHNFPCFSCSFLPWRSLTKASGRPGNPMRSEKRSRNREHLYSTSTSTSTLHLLACVPLRPSVCDFELCMSYIFKLQSLYLWIHYYLIHACAHKYVFYALTPKP